MEFTEIFARLSSVVGPSSFEDARARVIADMLSPYADELCVDRLNNLIVHRRGAGKRLMLEAHADTTGFIVTGVSEGGLLKFEPLGGFVAARLVDVELRFANGRRGVICGSREGFALSRSVGEISCGGLYIDTGLGSRERAAEFFSAGDAAVFARAPEVVDGRVLCAPYIDNLACCACIIKAVMDEPECRANDLYLVFSAQEENGCRCAGAAAERVRPDFALSMDVTGASDYPASPIPEAGIAFGGGPVVKIKDGRTVYDRGFTALIERLAGERGIGLQRIFMASESNAYRIQRSGEGVTVAGMGIATKNIHTPFEMISLDDAARSVEVLRALIRCEL